MLGESESLCNPFPSLPFYVSSKSYKSVVTPILTSYLFSLVRTDIKPYIPAFDSFPTARAGWMDDINPNSDQSRVEGYQNIISNRGARAARSHERSRLAAISASESEGGSEGGSVGESVSVSVSEEEGVSANMGESQSESVIDDRIEDGSNSGSGSVVESTSTRES